MAKDERPNLDLSVRVSTTAGNEFELKPTAKEARNRVRSLNWRTKLGEGFSDGGGELPRRVDQDHPDIGLMDLWTVVDDGGETLYEGRLAGNPRTLDQTHSVSVTLVGRMADAKRRKFCQVFVDRDPSHWTEPPLAYRAAEAVAGTSQGKIQASTAPGGLVWDVPIELLPITTEAALVYTSPSEVTVAFLGYQGTRTGTWTNFEAATLFTSDLEDFSSGVGSVALTLNSTPQYVAVTTPAKYGLLRARVSTAHTPAAPVQQRYDKVAVYGDTGLSTYAPITTTDLNGIRATDALKYIVDNYCPGLSSAGVQDAFYVIPHLEFRDRAYPYDAFLQINKYLLWKLACWEDGVIVFEPHDLTDYTWQIRTDDPNVSIEWQGPSTETIYNGAAVTYVDLLTGVTTTITPDTNPELADVDPENPFNKADIPQWLEVTLSTPQLEDDAAAIGAAELAEANRPKAPGSFTVTGHIRDRAGNWQHVGKVRAGETLAITNHPNDDPRLIVETDYQDDHKQVRIATDLPFNLIEAMMDRVDVELQAGGLRM